MDLLPKTFTERGVGHILDNLETTTKKKKSEKSLEEQEFERNYKQNCDLVNETKI